MLKNEFKKNSISMLPEDDRIDGVDDISSSDSEQDQNDIDYKWTKSDASFDISKIQNFVLGGITSRFWLFRKHMNHKSQKYFRLN